MLAGGHLVVLGGGRDRQLPKLLVQVRHELTHPVADDPEILVVQLLALRGGSAEQGPAGVNQVPALHILLPVHQKILLLRAHAGGDLFGGRVAKKPQDAQGLGVDGLHGPQQGGLFIQGFPGVGHEDGGDTQNGPAGHLLHEGGGGHVPGGVAAGVVGGAQAPGGERGRVRLTHDKLLAGELQNGLAVLRGGEERVVLFRRDAGEGLEPVGIVGRALFHRPVLHGVGHDVGGLHADVAAVLHHVHHLLVDLLGEALLHHGFAEYIHPKNVGNVHLSQPFPVSLWHYTTGRKI